MKNCICRSERVQKMDNQITLNVSEFFSKEELKEIAEQELRAAFRAQFQKESDVERVIVNLSWEYVCKLVAEQWDGDFEELLRQKVRKAIGDGVGWQVFRRKDAWDRTESPAVKIMDEELKNSRPLIRAAIEKHIAEYPFHELDKTEIAETIWEVVMEKILAPRGKKSEDQE